MLPDILEELKKIAKSLEGGVITPGLVNFEGLGQVDGAPAEITFDGELHNGALP